MQSSAVAVGAVEELTAERARAVFLQYAEELLEEVAGESDEAVLGALSLAVQCWNAAVQRDFYEDVCGERLLWSWLMRLRPHHRKLVRLRMEGLLRRKREHFADVPWQYGDVRLRRAEDGARIVNIDAIYRSS